MGLRPRPLRSDSPSVAPPPGLRSRSGSGVCVDGGGVRLSSRYDPDPEDIVEIRLTGRRSEESEGVADGARSLLLMEAVDRRADSGERVGLSQ